jgi:hypothetical protein
MDAQFLRCYSHGYAGRRQCGVDSGDLSEKFRTCTAFDTEP